MKDLILHQLIDNKIQVFEHPKAASSVRFSSNKETVNFLMTNYDETENQKQNKEDDVVSLLEERKPMFSRRESKPVERAFSASSSSSAKRNQ